MLTQRNTSITLSTLNSSFHYLCGGCISVEQLLYGAIPFCQRFLISVKSNEFGIISKHDHVISTNFGTSYYTFSTFYNHWCRFWSNLFDQIHSNTTLNSWFGEATNPSLYMPSTFHGDLDCAKFKYWYIYLLSACSWIIV